MVIVCTDSNVPYLSVLSFHRGRNTGPLDWNQHQTSMNVTLYQPYIEPGRYYILHVLIKFHAGTGAINKRSFHGLKCLFLQSMSMSIPSVQTVEWYIVPVISALAPPNCRWFCSLSIQIVSFLNPGELSKDACVRSFKGVSFIRITWNGKPSPWSVSMQCYKERHMNFSHISQWCLGIRWTQPMV